MIPRVRTSQGKGKTKRHCRPQQRKEAVCLETIRRLEEEQKLLRSYIKDGKISFAELPEIEPHVRDVFCCGCQKHWRISIFAGKQRAAKFIISKMQIQKETCMLHAKDGILQMPAYTIRFEEKKMNALEILLGRRWILKSRDRELYYRMKDEAPAIKKFLTEKLGYQMIVNPYLIKIENASKAGELDGDSGI